MLRTYTAQAVEFNTKAAEAGDSWAQTKMGMRLLKGEGVEQSDGKAILWLEMAAKQKSKQAIAKLSELRTTNPAAFAAVPRPNKEMEEMMAKDHASGMPPLENPEERPTEEELEALAEKQRRPTPAQLRAALLANPEMVKEEFEKVSGQIRSETYGDRHAEQTGLRADRRPPSTHTTSGLCV